MTNLENYFGISVKLSTELDPISIEFIKEKAISLTKLVNFDIQNFNVYVHTITIFKKRGHFAFDIPIENIIDELEVKFQVNKKQKNTGQIKFFNYLVTENLPEGIKEGYGEHELIRKFSGSFIQKNDNLYTELITFIDKSLTREHFKKIKLHIEGFPTRPYSNDYLSKTKKGEFITSFDIKYTKSIQLKIKFPTEKEQLNTIYAIELQEKLKKLKNYLQESSEGDFKTDIYNIEKALEEVHTNNDINKALKFIKKIGKSTLSIAKDIGINLISDIISNSS